MKYDLYSDGACQPNPGKGGWAFILMGEDGSKFVEQGFQSKSTNNRMELLAVLNGIRCFKSVAKSDDFVCVYSDSQYLVDGITQWSVKWAANNWIKKDGDPVLNDDIWRSIRGEFDGIGCKYSCQHIAGHSGHVYNEMVDKLAVEMVKKHG